VGTLVCIPLSDSEGGIQDPPGHRGSLPKVELSRGSSKNLFMLSSGAEVGSLLLLLLRARGSLVRSCHHPQSEVFTPRDCAKSAKSAESAPKALDDPEEEQLFRDLWEDEPQREIVLESLKADCEVRTGRPPGL
jgi:hypothetical protein